MEIKTRMTSDRKTGEIGDSVAGSLTGPGAGPKGFLIWQLDHITKIVLGKVSRLPYFRKFNQKSFKLKKRIS